MGADQGERPRRARLGGRGLAALLLGGAVAVFSSAGLSQATSATGSLTGSSCAHPYVAGFGAHRDYQIGAREGDLSQVSIKEVVLNKAIVIKEDPGHPPTPTGHITLKLVWKALHGDVICRYVLRGGPGRDVPLKADHETASEGSYTRVLPLGVTLPSNATYLRVYLRRGEHLGLENTRSRRGLT